MEFLLSWLILSFAVWATAALLPGFHVKNFGSAILAAAVFGVLNFFLGWIFFTLFAVATLGLALIFTFLTRWVINTLLLMLTAAVLKDFKVDGVGWALLGALVMSGVGTLSQWALMQVFG